MMENGLKTLACLLAVAGTISCIQEETDRNYSGEAVEVVFTAHADDSADEPTSKTTLHTDGKSVHWSDEDRIMVFSGTTNGVTSHAIAVQDNRALADFMVMTPLSDTYHAVYPPYEGATMSTDMGYITTVLPTVQTPVEGSFADGVNLAVAKSEGARLFFKNVGAILAIKNPSNNVGSIKLMSRDTKMMMSGEATIDYNNGEPEVVSSPNGKNYVEFNSGLPNTGGKTFNFVVYPGSYSGFDIILTSAWSPYLKSVYGSSKKLELKRNDNYLLFELPSNISFSWNSIAEPTSVSASAGNWMSANVSWTWDYTIPSGQTDPRSGYRIHVRKSGNTEVLKTIDVNDISATSYTVDGLEIDKYYDFGVQTLKTGTNQKPSEIVWAENVWINGDRCIPPTPVSIEQISETQVTVTWRNNTGSAQQQMFWKKEVGGTVNTAILDANATSYTTSIIAGHTYEFGIQAKKNVKTGQYTIEDSVNDSEIVYFDPFVAMTWEDLLDFDAGANECLTPEQVSVSLNGQQATVTWQCYSSAATGYNVYIRESDEKWSKGFCAVKGVNDRSHTFLKQLEYGKTYYLGVQAVNSASMSRNSDIVAKEVLIIEPTTELFDWEKNRTAIPSWSDMTLCYGGNPWRVPTYWDENRFASHALYRDKAGTLHYLFDAFLALDFEIRNYTLNYDDTGRHSARKQEWSELISYWFDENNGFQALDDCIAEAAKEIGAPKTKRYVIFVLPDPIYCDVFTNKSSSTTYWGKYEDGSTANFSTASGRIRAYKWMIDQVRAQFAAKKYQYIELAGFYILQETLSNYNNQYKEWSTVLPKVATYCHGYKEGFYWIPYGYQSSDQRHNNALIGWKDFGFDLAILQPGEYWDYSGSRSWSTTCDGYINKYGMGMEIEFEGSHGEDLSQGGSSILYYRTDGTVNAKGERNKDNLKAYLDAAVTYGIYGKKPIVLYSGSDAMHELATSKAAADIEIYHELCQFIINSPLKK